MRVSLNWLKELVDIGDDYKSLEKKFNLMSQEVESLYKLIDIDNLVIGHVLTCEKHPEADKLSVTTVDVSDEVLQIICGAPNIAAGQKVIVSKVGACLPGDFRIKKSKIRGIESNGMICSLEELGIKEFDSEETGIYVLGDDAQVGQDPLKYLHLDDYVLELDLTANRSDLLSMEGVAYDVACMLDKEYKPINHSYDKRKQENNIKVFTDTKDCSAYYGQVIDNIKIGQSPYWLKSRLIAAGIRPINNVVDITNYVMLQYGQPLHAFDYDKLKTDTIIVRHAREGEILRTLDDQERKLVTADLVITDGKRPIALAGVMGGKTTEVDKATNKILLESAFFDPMSIRKTSKRLDLRSESSSRFEKGIDPGKMKKAMDYATTLFINLAGGQVVGDYSFFDTTVKEPTVIHLSLEKLNQVTGRSYSLAEVKDVLRRLDFDYHMASNDSFKINVPTRRQNVFGYQDIVEEIVRISGFDKIPLTIPSTPTYGYLTKIQKLRRTIRNYLVNIGFNETVSYSLVNEKQATEFDQTPLSVVEIMNPLNKEKAFLRHSLIPSLLEILQYNKARKISDVFLFELGRSYRDGHEVEQLSGLMTGIYSASLWQGKKETTDFYLLKGIVEDLLAKIGIVDYKIVKAEKPLAQIDPGMVADIFLGQSYLGYLGKLHPQKEYDLGLDKTYVFEFDFVVLSEASKDDLVMMEIPKFPSVSRDLAIVIEKQISADRIIDEVRIAGKKTLKDVDIFDQYIGQGIDPDKKSIAMTLTLQNNEKTLEAKEVDTIVERIIKHLEKTLSAKLR